MQWHHRVRRPTSFDENKEHKEDQARDQETINQGMRPRHGLGRLQAEAEQEAPNHANESDRTEEIHTPQLRCQTLVLHLGGHRYRHFTSDEGKGK